MSEECIEASPQSQKRRRRLKRQWTKPRKKFKWNREESTFDNSKNFSDTKELSTIEEEKLPSCRHQGFPLVDISMLYNDQISEDELDKEGIDIYANEKLIEKVSLQVEDLPVRHVWESICTQEFIAACDFRKMQHDPQHSEEIKADAGNPAESQFVTESQIEKLCEAADFLADIKKEEIQFSQWDSPVKTVSADQRVHAGVSKSSVAQAISDDFDELCSSSQSPQSGSPQIKKPIHIDSPKNSLKTQVLRTYSRQCKLKERKIVPLKLADPYDSDSKYSLTSELSMQNDELLDCSPISDNVDLNKSTRVCENLQSLSSFFSQSFTQGDVDNTADGVYRFIMLKKAKRKEARLLDWYRSAKNFKLCDTPGSADFEGFHDSEIESVQSDPSQISDNIQDFLDIDDDVFHEVGTSFFANSIKEPVTVQTYTDKDIESVLESADKVLAEVTEHFNLKDRLLDGNENLRKVPLDNIKSMKPENKLEEGKHNFNKLKKHGEYNSSSENINQSLPKIKNKDLNLNASFTGFQSASGKNIELSEEAKQKANSILAEFESWTDEDLFQDFNALLCEIDNSKIVRPLKETNRVGNAVLNQAEDEQQTQKYCKENHINTRKRKLTVNNRVRSSTKRTCRNEVIKEHQFYNKSANDYKEFSSASGNAIYISENSQPRAQKKYATIKKETTGLVKNVENVETSDYYCKKGTIFKPAIVPPKISENDDAFVKLSIAFGGFQSASGKAISISQTALAKAETIYAEIENDITGLEKFVESAETTDLSCKIIEKGVSFSPAIKPSEFCKTDDTFVKPSTLLGRLETSPGKVISLHKNSFAKAKIKNGITARGKLAEGAENDDFSCKVIQKRTSLNRAIELSKISENDDAFIKLSVGFGGFQSASGKDIPISQNALEKAERIYAEIENDKTGLEQFVESAETDDFPRTIIQNDIYLNSVIESPQSKKDDAFERPLIAFESFQSASGDAISISENTLANAKVIHTEIKSDKAGLEKCIENAETVKIPCKGASLNPMKESPKIGRVDAFVKPSNEFGGFQSASGKAISISRNALAKAEMIYAQIENDETGLKNFVASAETEEISSNTVQKGTSLRLAIESTESKKNAAFIKSQIAFGTFQSASGKGISISQNALAKAEKIYAEIENDTTGLKYFVDSAEAADISCSIIRKCTNLKSTFVKPLVGYGGFQSASGNAISISQNALAKAERIYAEIKNDKAGLEKFIESSETVNISCQGASLNHMIESPKLRKDDAFVKPSNEFGGFQSASGKTISISKNSLGRAEGFYAEIEKDISGLKKFVESAETNDLSCKIIEKSTSFNPKRAAEINTNQEQIGMGIDKKIENNSTSSASIKFNRSFPTVLGGFQSVSGKDIQISAAAMEKARSLYNEIDNFDGINELADIFLEEFVIPAEGGRVSHIIAKRSLKDGEVNAVPNIETEARKIENTHDIFSMSTSAIQQQKVSKAGIYFDDGSNIDDKNFSKSKQSSAQLILDNSAHRYNTRLKSSHSVQATIVSGKQNPTLFEGIMKNNASMHRKRLKPIATKKADIFCTPVKVESEAFQLNTPDLKEFFNSVKTSTPQPNKRKYNLSLTQEISASTAALLEDELSKSSVTDDFRKICWNDYEDSLKENGPSPKKLKKNLSNIVDIKELSQKVIVSGSITRQLKNARATQRQKQLEIIKSKKLLQAEKSPGSLFIKKKQKGRVTWKSIVRDQEPKTCTAEELDRMGFPGDIANIHFSNATHFKFDGLCFYAETASKAYIELADGVQVIPDDYNKIGLHEIEQAFLTMIGVSPSLIPPNWIQHHYKMILLKFSWLEKSFPAVLLNRVCTPENIILQLKYRYDREIDNTERSVLKKILECDDSPVKRMVLLVLDIYHSSAETELELTDGWYSIRTTIDLAMHRLISSGKVGIGTKLMIQNAELCNCETGCSPLEVPPQVRLKIHTNSTRRTKWDIKLGLYKDPRPFCITLDSVIENAGFVTRLSLSIIRIYPMVYMNKNGNSRGVHSEKMEMRLRSQEEKVDFDNFEIIFSQMQKQIEHETKMKRRKIGEIRKFIQNNEDPTDLLELVEEGFDLEDIELDLSHEQQKRFVEYQQEISLRKMQEVHQRVKEHLENQSNKRSSTEMLKVRIIDSKRPGKSAILSIWRPQEHLRKILQEGISFEISNCTPSGVRHGDIQLNSTKTSEYKFNGEEKQISSIRYLFRKFTTIKEINSRNFVPMFNEVDTYGLVVMITISEPKKFQSVFICDFEENIVCINFWNGIKEYAYDDVIQADRFLVANNLQWRTSSTNGDMPCLFVTELSNFTENPKTECSAQKLNAFKAQFISKNLTEFTMKCSAKIKQLKSSGKVLGRSFATPVRKCLLSLNTPSPTNSSLARLPRSASIAEKSPHVPSPQNRIDRLKMYGTPPTISPLAFKKSQPSVRKSFKMPRKLTDDMY